MADGSLQLAPTVVAQIGARRHYAIPEALASAGALECLYTDFWMNERLASALPAGLRRGAFRRIGDRRAEVPEERVRTFPGFTISRRLRRRFRNESDLEFYLAANRSFCRRVAKAGFGNGRAVYVFNGAGLEILRVADAKGLTCFIDQTAAAMRHDVALLAEEAARWPDWPEATSFDKHGHEAFCVREETEWQHARRIICGSQYVADTLHSLGVAEDVTTVVPYGVAEDFLRQPAQMRKHRDGPLRVLFAGTLNLRKGVPWLYEASRLLAQGTAEFRLVGPARFEEAAVRRLAERFDVRGSVPRSEMREHYAWADAFILPTISEGSANVCYEALACGLPVVTTQNAGSVVRDDYDGLVVPVRDAQALADAVQRLAEEEGLLSVLSGNARKTAESLPWSDYHRRLLEAMA